MEDIFAQEDAGPVSPYVYRHKSTRRYMVGDPQVVNGTFTFNDYELTILESTQEATDARNALFRKIMAEQPRSERIGIVEVNEEARRNAEKPLDDPDASGVIRGTATAEAMLTAADRARIADAQRGSQAPAMASLGAGTPAAGGPKAYVPQFTGNK